MACCTCSCGGHCHIPFGPATSWQLVTSGFANGTNNTCSSNCANSWNCTRLNGTFGLNFVQGSANCSFSSATYTTACGEVGNGQWALVFNSVSGNWQITGVLYNCALGSLANIRYAIADTNINCTIGTAFNVAFLSSDDSLICSVPGTVSLKRLT